MVVFDNETKAYEGTLLQLDGEGSISVYAWPVLAKHADGTATVSKAMTPCPSALSSEPHSEV